jgi:Glycogen synthase
MSIVIRVSTCSSKAWPVSPRSQILLMRYVLTLGIKGLNYRLQQTGSKTTVVAFLIMPAVTHSYTVEALKGQAVTKQLRDTVTEIANRIGSRLFERTARYSGWVA